MDAWHICTKDISVGLLDLEHLSDATPTESTNQGNRLERISRLFTLRLASGSGPLAQAIRRARQGESQSPADNEDNDDDDDDEGGDSYYIRQENRRDISELFPPVIEPQKAGQDLLNSGEFGKISTKQSTINLARLLRKRSTLTRRFTKEDLISVMIKVYGKPAVLMV